MTALKQEEVNEMETKLEDLKKRLEEGVRKNLQAFYH